MLIRYITLGLTLAFLAGCSVMQSQQQSDPVDLDSRFAVIPLGNLSQTPQAGDQAASILSALLRARGATEVELYLPADDNPLIYDNHGRQQEATEAAKESGADIIVSGTVDEWRYKSGLDGEPAVGITLVFRNADDNSVIWSGTGARTGWGREGVTVAGHKVLEELLDEMPVIGTAR
ncbi:hypothetical protein [uncultured Marinobacter sp.]|uniref:hypothetical protein n=1 Tax=uncultured Marinobacter sp. TaxID=187379 RepID=UPI00262DACD6|nr:hypothetical protein [uncultured Marinobacter sp.]